MALIHILDKQSDKIIGTLNLGEYTDDEKVLSSENENTFDFTALKKFDLLQKRNRLLLQDKDGFFSEYIIIYAEQNSRNQKFIKSNATFTDLQKAKVIEPQVLQGATADTATTKALEGTEWRKGRVDYNGIRTIKIEEYTNPYNLLKIIASEFGLDLRFRVAVEGNKIVRYVDLTLPDDEFDGKEVVFGKDLIGLRRIEDAQNIVTALLVLGPEQEDGKRLTVLVEDNDALQRWGRNGQHLIEVYEPQITAEEVTVERLQTLGQNALQKRIDALVTYECQAAILEDILGKEHEKVRLDRTIRIKDEGYTPPLYVEAKVLEVKEQPSTGKILDFKLGNYKEYSEADLEAQVATLKKLLSQKASNAQLVETYTLALQQAEEKAAQAEENAKGYTDTVKVQVVEHANTVANQAESNAREHADTVAGEAESNAKAYAMSEADKARIAAIQAAATDAQTKVNAAKTALEASIAEKADAEWVNGQLVSKADKASTYTKTEVDNALNSKVSVTQYNTDMNGVVTRLNSAESRITQNENEIATKVSNTTYQQDKTTINNNISQLTTRMGQAETELQQTSSQIALKANKTDVYTKTETDNKFTSVNQQISQLDAELSVQADQIATKVSKTEFESLQIGGRNYVLNSDKEIIIAHPTNGYTQAAFDMSDIVKNSVNKETYTISFDAIPYTKGTDAFHSIVIGGNAGGDSWYHRIFIDKDFTITKNADDSSHYVATFTVDRPNGQDFGISQRFIAEYGATGGTIKNLTVVRGNKELPWSPAPEDTQSQIDGLASRMSTAETGIQQTASAIELKANKTDVYTKTEADGKITTAVNNAKAEIKVTTDSISQSVSSLQSTVNSQGTRLSSAESSITSLSTQIQSKVTMADVSMALGDSINYASWDKSNIDTFPLTKGTRDTTVFRTSFASIKLAPGETQASFKKPRLPVNPGEKIYYEFWILTDSGWDGKSDNSKLRFGDQNGGLLGAYGYNGVKTTWTKYSGTFVVPNGVTSLIISFGNDGTTGNVWIDDIILAKQSQWESLLAEQTNLLTTRLSTAESTITQQAGLIASKAESSTVTALGTRVTTAEQNINSLTGEINQRVKTTDYNGNTIASLINQTATTIKLQASKINLVGAVTVLSDITGNLGDITAGNISGVNISGVNITGSTIISDGVWQTIQSRVQLGNGVITVGNSSANNTVSPVGFIVEQDGGRLHHEFGADGVLFYGSAADVSKAGIYVQYESYGNGISMVFDAENYTAVTSKFWVRNNEARFQSTENFIDPEPNVRKAIKASGGIATDGLYANAGSISKNAIATNGKIYVGGEGIELSWVGGTPYIDFSRRAGVDFDMRLILETDSGLAIRSSDNIVRHKFYANGTKSGGSIEIDGKNLGMSPIDSPQVLLETIEFDVPLTADGTKVLLDSRFAKAVNYRFAVFPNNGRIIEKGADYFVIAGDGLADIRIVGERVGYAGVYFDDMTMEGVV